MKRRSCLPNDPKIVVCIFEEFTTSICQLVNKKRFSFLTHLHLAIGAGTFLEEFVMKNWKKNLILALGNRNKN